MVEGGCAGRGPLDRDNGGYPAGIRGIAPACKRVPPLCLRSLDVYDLWVQQWRTRHATAVGAGTGLVVGTLAYLAPERLQGAPATPQSDIYAAGVVVYEALTGRVVFRRDTQAEVMRAVLKEPVPPLLEAAPNVPRALADVTHLS